LVAFWLHETKNGFITIEEEAKLNAI